MTLRDEETLDETCPWCGHQQTDLWEHSDDDTETECENCGKEIRIVRHVSIDYSISKVAQ